MISFTHKPQRLILPPSLTRLSAPLDVDRSPIRARCECGRLDILCVPNATGEIHWTCKCGRKHGIGFRPEAESHGQSNETLQRKPIEHLCQTPKCEYRTCIVLPEGDGELRWTCPDCSVVWGMRFKADGQVDLYKVL
jgi:hypothetical protein